MTDFVDRPIRLRFRFSLEEANALGDLARANGVTAAELVRNWLHAAIDNQAQRRTP